MEEEVDVVEEVVGDEVSLGESEISIFSGTVSEDVSEELRSVVWFVA